MNTKIFKAYDVRGKYPEEINEGTVAEIAEALAKYFKRGKIIVAHDARLSSKSLYRTILKQLPGRAGTTNNSKLITLPVGLATTPMFYFLVNKLKAAGGIMITASHNPKEFNGLKVVGPKAEPISGKEIYELYKNLR